MTDRTFTHHISVVALFTWIMGLSGSALLLKAALFSRLQILSGQTIGETRIEGTSFPKRLTNTIGAPVQIITPPKRIASAMLAADEILTLLSPGQLVAVTHLADNKTISNCSHLIPTELPRIHSGIEAILASEPEIVFAAAFTRPETIQVLAAIKIPVVLFSHYDSFDDIMKNIALIGSVLGKETGADEIISNMNRRILGVEARVAKSTRPQVLYYGFDGYTAGRDTLIDEMIRRGGGSNLAATIGISGSIQVSVETAIALQPEMIIVSNWEVPGNSKAEESTVRHLLDNPLWKAVPAIRNRRICSIRGASLTAVSHYAVRGLEEVARCLHPGNFL